MSKAMTTPQALRQLVRCHAVIAVNTVRGIHLFVTRKPWLAMFLLAVASFALSATSIMQARAERDAALKKQAQLQQQVEQLSCLAEARKEARR